jgi:aldehyde:ferredoxin oxidoreductase
MRAVTVQVPRFERMHAWANRILRIDLSDMRIWAQESAPHVPDYLGARGVAARIAWDEYPEPAGEFDPANPLVIMTGALTGSRSPYSGRTNVCAFSPQAYPYAWLTRSSIGGRFGGELKRAGYDGIVVTGVSDRPVRVRIRDDEVSILAASELWGRDTMDTLEALEAAEGKGVRSLVIGPAGERLSRIATIQTASSSAAGQGGFGGVMGSKKLKAISVVGTGRVSLASPGAMTALTRTLARRFKEAGLDQPAVFGQLDKLNAELAVEGGGRARCEPCTEGCLTPCAVHFRDMPGVVHNRKRSGSWFCFSAIVQSGPPEWFPPQIRDLLDWRLDRSAAFEMNVLSNRYGLNQYDILMGVVPWLIASQKGGEIRDLNGLDMDWNSAETWAEFLHATAYREGLGDILAEGGWAAARTLQAGEAAARTQYAGWGHAAHWDGHTGIGPVFPFWLVSALQWLSDTRDPYNSGHGSLWAGWEIHGRVSGLQPHALREAELDKIRAIGEHLYGSADAVDPLSGYQGKAPMGHFHTLRPVIKDCVPVDDFRFPCIYDEKAPDRYWRLEVDGIGEIEGPSVEYHLFRAGTGLDWSESDFERRAESVCALERALQVRHWGRDRRTDEMLLPYFESVDAVQSPFLDRRHGLDRDQFQPVMDEFYALHGWDEDGRPTRKALDDLGMADVYEPMVEGAAKARESLLQPSEQEADTGRQ